MTHFQSWLYTGLFFKISPTQQSNKFIRTEQKLIRVRKGCCKAAELQFDETTSFFFERNKSMLQKRFSVSGFSKKLSSPTQIFSLFGLRKEFLPQRISLSMFLKKIILALNLQYISRKKFMIDQSIFLGQDSYSKKDSEINFISDVDNPKYIEQFIFSLKQINPPGKEEANKKKLQNYKIFFQSQTASLQAKDKKKMTSNYHNFQKHLVLTLRKQANIEEFFYASEKYELHSKIWRQFLNAKYATKTLICITFGGIPYDSKQNKKEIKHYGFQGIYKKYFPEEIKEAQEVIKTLVIKKLESLNLELALKNRKLNKKKQFGEYFNQFIFEVVSGNYTKRFVDKKLKKSDQSPDHQSGEQANDEQNDDGSGEEQVEK